MTRCGDCLYYPTCAKYVDKNESFPEVGGCEAFKNKADFAEVVRCKDCKWWMPFKANLYCRGNCENEENGLYEFSKPEDFCSYGERKEGD